jgi:MFS transporter, ACS family, glucarate transporter
MKKVSPGVRYRVLAMTVALAFLTYMDRVCISVTAPAILRDLRLTTIQMGFVFSAFTAAYALFEIPTGWWADRIGSRGVLTRIVIWWSVFTGLTGAAWDFRSLLALRALFGAGEAGAWPTVARALSRWFPEQERGTAQGIFFMGAHLGGGLTPILVAAIAVRIGWRATFPVLSILWIYLGSLLVPVVPG